MDREAEGATVRNLVFVSYSHADALWLSRLKIHLKPLERRGAIEVWDDQRLRVGVRWRDEIKTALRRARVAVLLVSPDFLASDFIADHELPPLLRSEKDLTVIWIPVRPSNFQATEIGNYQAALDPGRTLAEMNEAEADRALVAATSLIARAFTADPSTDAPTIVPDEEATGASHAASHITTYAQTDMATAEMLESPTNTDTAFIGRVAELTTLRQLYEPHRHPKSYGPKSITAHIHGIHGVGKTSLLAQHASMLSKRGLKIYYVNFQHTASNNGAFTDNFLPQKPSDKTLIERLWNQIRHLPQDGSFIIFDEIEAILHHSSEQGVIEFLRLLCGRSDGPHTPKIAVIARRNWIHVEYKVMMDSPRLESYLPAMTLGPLAPDDRATLIAKTGESANVLLSDASRRALSSLSGGIPFLIRRWVKQGEPEQAGADAYWNRLIATADWYFDSLWGGLSGLEKNELLQAIIRRLDGGVPPQDGSRSEFYADRLGGSSAAFCWWLTRNLDAAHAETETSVRKWIAFQPQLAKEFTARMADIATISRLLEIWTD